MKRRYKLIIILVISFILVISCYFLFYRYQKSIVAIGYNMFDYDYVDYISDNYSEKFPIIYRINDEDLQVSTFLTKLTKNKDNIKYYLKNAEIIILNFGTKELNNYKELDNYVLLDYLNNVYEILFHIRELNKHKIILLNMYDAKFAFINNKLSYYAQQHDILYIDRTSLKNKDFYEINHKVMFRYTGHQKIANYIMHDNYQNNK